MKHVHLLNTNADWPNYVLDTCTCPMQSERINKSASRPMSVTGSQPGTWTELLYAPAASSNRPVMTELMNVTRSEHCIALQCWLLNPNTGQLFAIYLYISLLLLLWSSLLSGMVCDIQWNSRQIVKSYMFARIRNIHLLLPPFLASWRPRPRRRRDQIHSMQNTKALHCAAA